MPQDSLRVRVKPFCTGDLETDPETKATKSKRLERRIWLEEGTGVSTELNPRPFSLLPPTRSTTAFTYPWKVVMENPRGKAEQLQTCVLGMTQAPN